MRKQMTLTERLMQASNHDINSSGINLMFEARREILKLKSENISLYRMVTSQDKGLAELEARIEGV